MISAICVKKKMEEAKSIVGVSESTKHALMIPYPSQGHLNPMLQFSKRLSTKGVRVTIVTTIFISKSMHLNSSSLPNSIQFDIISDGYDQGGFYQSDSIGSYLADMESKGSKDLRDLIKKYKSSNHPIDCIVYDPFLTWALDVAKEFGLVGAALFTQMCAVNYTYYCVHHGTLKLPLVSSLPISIHGLPLLELKDTPSFVHHPAFYPAYFQMVMNQFSNIHKADFLLVNSFYKLEDQMVDTMSKLCPLLTIGPTTPSFHLDKGVPNDTENDLNLFQLDSTYITWFNQKPPGSVVYVSYGSMVSLSKQQMEEIGLGLKATRFNFLWVITDMERKKVRKEFLDDITESGSRGLVVNWIPQLGVLSNRGVGCFLTHCGWNSTMEALSLGVPMVAMPQWTDQPMNAKFVEDVWKVGVRVKVSEDGVVTREEIESCIRLVMDKDVGREMRGNAIKWRHLAVEAVTQGGTSDNNINSFVNHLMKIDQRTT